MQGPQQEQKDIEKHEKDLLQKKSDALTESIINSSNIEAGRKNELKTNIKIGIRFIAKSLDEGVVIEIIPPYVSEPKEVAEDAEDDKKEKLVAEKEKYELNETRIEALRSASLAMKKIAEFGAEFTGLLSGMNDDQLADED